MSDFYISSDLVIVTVTVIAQIRSYTVVHSRARINRAVTFASNKIFCLVKSDEQTYC